MTLPRGIDRFRGRYRVRLTIGGQRVLVGLFATLREAVDARAAVLARVGPTRGLTLRRYAMRYLDDRETDGFHRAPHQDRSTYRRHIETAPFIDRPLKRIKRVDVARWCKTLARKQGVRPIRRKVDGAWRVELVPTGRPLSVSTMRSALSLLSMMLGDAADDGLVSANPCVGVRLPRKRARVTKPWTYLEADEVAALLGGELPAKQAAFFAVAIYTGLRQGELCGLRWEDVAAERVTVRYSYRAATKGGRVRDVPLLRAAREALEVWRKHKPGIGSALVFPGRSGCHGRGYDAGWSDRYAARVGRHVRFHDLRHTFASHLMMGTWTERPWPIEAVRQVMGHASVTTTEMYAHLAPGWVEGLAKDREVMG